MVAVSRAPQPKLTAYAKRMGWTFPWFSSGGTDFNYDPVPKGRDEAGHDDPQYWVRPHDEYQS